MGHPTAAGQLIPITIIPGPPGNVFGPGIGLQVHTDYAGAVPLGSSWTIDFHADSEISQLAYRWNFNFESTTQFDWAGSDNQNISWQEGQITLKNGATSWATATLNNPNSTLIDQTAQPVSFPWDTQTGMPHWIDWHATNGSALTPVQAQQLSNADAAATQTQQLLPTFLQAPVQGVNDFLAAVHDAVIMNLGTIANPLPIGLANWFLPKPMDFLAPRQLAGPNACFPVDVDISGEAYYSLGVTIDTYPPDWRFATPGAEWSFHDLAVMTILRGGAISRRYGIHTLSFTVSPIPDSITQTVTDLPISIQPGDFHVQVDWAAGVCGSLFGYVLP